jgi:hypothetical protein
MADDREFDRVERIEALIAAARVERASAVRRLLQGLFWRRTDAPGWHPAAELAVGDCR